MKPKNVTLLEALLRWAESNSSEWLEELAVYLSRPAACFSYDNTMCDECVVYDKPNLMEAIGFAIDEAVEPYQQNHIALPAIPPEGV